MELNREELRKALRGEAVTSEKFFIHFLKYIGRANYEGEISGKTQSYFKKENNSEQQWIKLKKKVEAYNNSGFIKRWWLRNTEEEYKNIAHEVFLYHSHYLRFYFNYLVLYSPEFKLNNTIANHTAICTAFYESIKHIKPLLEIMKPKTGFFLPLNKEKMANQALQAIDLAYKEYYKALKGYQADDWSSYPGYLNMVARREYIGRMMMSFLNQLSKTNFEVMNLYFLKIMVALHEGWEKKIVLREKATFMRIDPTAFQLTNRKNIKDGDNSFPFVDKADNYVTGDKLIAWKLIPGPLNKKGYVHSIEDETKLPEFIDKLRPLLSSRTTIFLNVKRIFRSLFNKKSRFQQRNANEELKALAQGFRQHYDALLEYNPDSDKNDLKGYFYLKAQRKHLEGKIIAFIRNTMPDPISTPEGFYFLRKITAFYEKWGKILDSAENTAFESLSIPILKTENNNECINTINEEEQYISLDQLLSWASCQQKVFEDTLNEKEKAESEGNVNLPFFQQKVFENTLLRKEVNLPFFITNIYRWLKYQEKYYKQMISDEREIFLENYQAKVRTFFLNLCIILDKKASPIFALGELKEFKYLDSDSPIYRIFKTAYSDLTKGKEVEKDKIDFENRQAVFTPPSSTTMHYRSASFPSNKVSNHASFFSHQRTSSLNQAVINNRPRSN